ncbi:RNA polymerase sigma factor [Plantactinospora mayteni]|uniref:DNA-directed RNA polymerase sigma-70 factor n=1 Tax=Plantactinospora mayteni TaxID=566021 RepID=A0ABQ4EM79_9ACTN|nr:sigma-70 family RNA polymerase sigma factor [Plantactinospora mayteni]GIG95476.1 DNA-directed RNA polymerase sigma-70 factor [Plantactinospora mayteni]
MDDERTARFEAIYAATFSRILGFALRRCDGPEDAADVVAETFAIAWRRMDAVPPGDQARLWLYGVARNVLANHRRQVARRHDLSAALAAEVAHLYQPSAEESAELGTVGEVLRGLPDDDREILSLVAWEGLEHGEIAKVLGCSRNAVRIRLHRARRRLARELATAGVQTGWLAMSGRGTR